ncbi:quinone-interacting membrane-bound oxidoreductase complex subunit QmoC [Candidatus Electrothrix sp.]|uniref:quinone-interacting membrane-bound oxidoreductase complex subunit QmoC n=1 Tax=Candidatus Electrothrix sp. TaxID=2170559 RepID=UPI0040563CEF
MNVQPDIEFIKDMKEAGGDTLKKCFQCATCSVVCPLSTDENPFPRQQMIYSQWGLKDKLIGDPNTLLCHHCGDCTTHCPRGAKPGDVMGAIRAYAYKFYGWPAPLANLASSGKNLPLLVAIPALVVFLVWLISGANVLSHEDFLHAGYTNFFGEGYMTIFGFKLLTWNVTFINSIMIPTAALAAFASFKGVTALWKKMSDNTGVGEALYRPSVPQFVKEFLWPSLVEIVQHERFKKCETNEERIRGHQPLMWAFIALFFVTIYSLISQDVLGRFIPSLHGPMAMWNPVKIVANVAAVAMIVGIVILWKNRNQMVEDNQGGNTFYDWFLIWMIAGVGVTGLGAEVLRLIGVVKLGYLVYYLHLLGYLVYYLHLVSVMMLFLYMPYTKFAHLIYRTCAMTFERYRDSAYVKNPVK